MHLFHPRHPSVHPTLEPRSTWAKTHAAQVSQWPTTLTTISDSRTRIVGFEALQHATEVAMGQACTGIEWVAEGGANQLYLMSLQDGSQVLARIAFPYPHRVRTGDEFAYQEGHDRARIPYRLQSEVATIRHVQDHTKIPVANVYAYDSNLENRVGSPYMLQSVLQGDVLADRWNDMNGEERTTIITSLGEILGQILSLVFDKYGSLKPDGSSIGPLVEPLESLDRDYPLTEAGPWPSSEPFLFALATRELQWLTSDPGKQLFKRWRESMYAKEDSTKTLQAFIQLAQTLLSSIPRMYTLFPLPKEACRPVLSHADFHYSNILVSHENPTIVVGVLDWECASTVPLWAAHVFPHKINDYGDKYETNPEWREEKRRLRAVFELACVGTYPDAAIVMQPEDEGVQRSLRGLRILSHIATSGVALYSSCEKMKEQLVEMLQCIEADNTGVVEMIKTLIALFS